MSSLILSLNPSPFSLLHKPLSPLPPPTLTPFSISKPSLSSFTTNIHLHASLSPSNPSNSDPEELRWLREEQRWLREENRWLREEKRWSFEREGLLREISELKLKIQSLDRQNSAQGASVSETLARVAEILQVLKDGDPAKMNRIAESGSGAMPMVLEVAESEEVKDVVVKEVVRVLEEGVRDEISANTTMKKAALRKGSEGEDVRAMQEALQKLGFYCGEEDMEFSSFSSGTERAVKTWQATVGVPEDGIMTVQLLENLHMGQKVANVVVNVGQGNDVILSTEGGQNGSATASVMEISKTEETITPRDYNEFNTSQHRVFLLGENRWEEPSRLTLRNMKFDESRIRSTATKCVACHGEGRLLCMECDGTGEPNIEPQFLEWIDEAMKCPYCAGVGYTVCDVCVGKT